MGCVDFRRCVSLYDVHRLTMCIKSTATTECLGSPEQRRCEGAAGDGNDRRDEEIPSLTIWPFPLTEPLLT